MTSQKSSLTERGDLMASSSVPADKRHKPLLPERLMPRSVNNQHSWNSYVLSIKLEKVGKVESWLNKEPKQQKHLYKTIILPGKLQNNSTSFSKWTAFIKIVSQPAKHNS